MTTETLSTAVPAAASPRARSPRQVRVAVVQPSLRVGAVEENLIQLEDLVRDAVRVHQPELVILPESVSSPTVHDPSLARAARPVDGAPLQLLRHLARELDVVIGGGFLAHRGHDVHSSYALAEPDGGVHLGNHDGSTFWGNHYSRGSATGSRTALAALDGAPVGVACGWEWASTDTARRLRHRVQLMVGGTCWPSYPLNWSGPLRSWMRREHSRQQQQARELPGQMARLLGVPVALAAHVGPTSFATPLAGRVAWDTELLGESQIVDHDGTVLARLSAADGEGHTSATVTLRPPAPLDPVTDLRWIPSPSTTTRAARAALRLHGALGYHSQRVLHRHHWQEVPGADLADEINPGGLGEQATATSGPRKTRAH
ncbi:MAG TPA: carbon-nitrogen hydrolase family protein [Pseudonocardia sp.]|jgi:predicted amidohydrolase|nr:carbon-nitrogen hydrolase family protein [Pseudonocardia sp.]